MSEISFVAYCTPEPQGSARGFVMRGKWGAKDRVVITSDNPDLKSFRQEVTKAALAAMAQANAARPMAAKHVPVSVSMDFYFAKPPSIAKKRTHMVVRPDGDKLARGCLRCAHGGTL